jgi:hypothetical protein
MKRVIEAAEIPLAGPDGTGWPIAKPDLVTFNGVGDEAYDAFYLSHSHVPNDGRGHHRGWVYWECQTFGNAGRRYDAVVIAGLILFAHHFFPRGERAPLRGRDDWAIFTKADEAAWHRGAALVEGATGIQTMVSVDAENEDVTIEG